MTTDQLVALFIGLITAVSSVVGGTIGLGRASRLRKGISEDLAMIEALPTDAGSRPWLVRGVERQSATLATLVAHPLQTRVYVYAFLAFVALGVVVIVLVVEGPGPLLLQEGAGRGVANWAYLLIGLVSLILLARSIRSTARARSRLHGSILGTWHDE